MAALTAAHATLARPIWSPHWVMKTQRRLLMAIDGALVTNPQRSVTKAHDANSESEKGV